MKHIFHPAEFRAGVSQILYTDEQGKKHIQTVTGKHISWCETDPEGFNLVHHPIELTHKVFHSIEVMQKELYKISYLKAQSFNVNIDTYEISRNMDTVLVADGYKYLHQLQELNFTLLGLPAPIPEDIQI